MQNSELVKNEGIIKIFREAKRFLRSQCLYDIDDEKSTKDQNEIKFLTIPSLATASKIKISLTKVK